MDDKRSQEVIAALKERGVSLPCPRCRNQQFDLVPGYFTMPVQDDPGAFVLGGKSLPTVTVLCKKCGYLAQHALGVLGLLDAPSGEVSS